MLKKPGILFSFISVKQLMIFLKKTMKKNALIPLTLGLVIGAGTMYFVNNNEEETSQVESTEQELVQTQNTPAKMLAPTAGLTATEAGPSNISFDDFEYYMNASDSAMAGKTYTQGMIFDVTKTIEMLEIYQTLQAEIDDPAADTLVLGIYPAYNSSNDKVNFYFNPVIMNKTNYSNLKQSHPVPYSDIDDYRTSPAKDIFRNHVYNLGNQI